VVEESDGEDSGEEVDLKKRKKVGAMGAGGKVGLGKNKDAWWDLTDTQKDASRNTKFRCNLCSCYHKKANWQKHENKCWK
jgi:hypothetical protein